MIYTPPELRRHGYARSLAAFQIDHMLGLEGFAVAHVIDDNVASMNLVASMGARHWEEPLVWRSVFWPGEAPRSEDKQGAEAATQDHEQSA